MTVINNVLLQTTSLQTPNIKKNKIFYLGGWCLEHKDINHETIFLKYPYQQNTISFDIRLLAKRKVNKMYFL